MERSVATVVGAGAAILMTVLALPPAAAQNQMLFGDLQIFGQDFLSARDPALAGAIGLGADSELMTGQAELDLNERLTFDRGQLSVADSVLWWQGSDGGSAQNDLLQAYVSVTPIPALTLVLGKQRISWGTGYAFFPGDRINPPVNPQNRSEGFYGITTSLSPSASLSITASVRFDTAFPALRSFPALPGPLQPASPRRFPSSLPTCPRRPFPGWDCGTPCTSKTSWETWTCTPGSHGNGKECCGPRSTFPSMSWGSSWTERSPWSCSTVTSTRNRGNVCKPRLRQGIPNRYIRAAADSRNGYSLCDSDRRVPL